MGEEGEGAAGIDGAQLGRVTDEQHLRPRDSSGLGDAVQGVGAGQGDLIEDDQLPRPQRHRAGLVVVEPLGTGLRRHIELGAQDLGCRSGGCEPDDGSLAVEVLPGVAEGAHGGGLARPCRTDQDIQHPPRPRHRSDRRGLVSPQPSSEPGHSERGDGRTCGGAPEVEQLVLGGQQGGGGEHDGVAWPEDAGPIGPSQLGRHRRGLGRGEPDRCLLGSIHDAGEDLVAVGGGGEADAHELPGGLGVQVPPPPRRPALTHHLEHPAGDTFHEPVGHLVGAEELLDLTALQDRPDQGGCGGAKDGGGPLMPGSQYIGECAGGLVGSGAEGGLLPQPDDRPPRRLPPMRCHIVGDELVGSRFDRPRPARERLQQAVRDAGDLPCRVAIGSPVPLLPHDPQCTGEVIGQDGVVVLRQRHHRRVDRPAIQ